jgi:chromosome segregation ATPase
MNFQPELDEIKTRLGVFESEIQALESETEAVIARLLARKSEIEASGKHLANLSSQCSELCSSLARLQALFSTPSRVD